jgi:hypothetical protein
LGLLSGIYGGLGPTVGSLVGGPLMKYMGLKKTFQLGAVVDAVALAFYSAYLLIQRYAPVGNTDIDSVSSDRFGPTSSTRLQAVRRQHDSLVDRNKLLLANTRKILKFDLPVITKGLSLFTVWLLCKILVLS